jgi:hypothetical protein
MTGRKPPGTSPPVWTTFRHRVVAVNPLVRPCGAGSTRSVVNACGCGAAVPTAARTARGNNSSFPPPTGKPGTPRPGLSAALRLSPFTVGSAVLVLGAVVRRDVGEERRRVERKPVDDGGM